MQDVSLKVDSMLSSKMKSRTLNRVCRDERHSMWADGALYTSQVFVGGKTHHILKEDAEAVHTNLTQHKV